MLELSGVLFGSALLVQVHCFADENARPKEVVTGQSSHQACFVLAGVCVVSELVGLTGGADLRQAKS